MKNGDNKINENEIVRDLSDEELEMNGGTKIPGPGAEEDTKDGSNSKSKIRGVQPPIKDPWD